MAILSIYAVGAIFLSEAKLGNLLVPQPAAILAGVTALFSLVAYIWTPQRFLYRVAFFTYVCVAITAAALIAMTGQLESPYVALWMSLSIFAGLFGAFGLSFIFLVVNGALGYFFFVDPGSLSREFLVMYLLALETPIIISYIIWHDKSKPEAQSKNPQAFDALAKQLSQVANKSEIVINAIADGVVAIDADGVVQLINPAAQRLLGWTKQDAVGLDYRSLIKLSDQNGQEVVPTQSPIAQVLASNQPAASNDLTLTSYSGKNILISLLVSPINSTAPSGAIAVFRDITAEKQQERQQAEFISTASHEMRTPVAAIEGYLALTLNAQTAAIDDRARAYLTKAHEATQHLGGLFQDLLTISKADDGRLVPRPVVIDVVAFLREMAEAFRQHAEAKNLEVSFKPGGGDEGVHTLAPVYYALFDEGHLREILSNLLDNAIKYTETGSITLDARGDEDNIVVSISDTGIGIPPEDVSHLFQKFYRIDTSDTREIGGTGLGLYISRRLAEANNGKIWVESTYGKGSTFFVQLPRVSHQQAEAL